jgi:hypothetical protein
VSALLNGASLARVALDLLDRAEAEQKKTKEGEPLFAYWHGVKVASRLILEQFPSAWAVLDRQRKKMLNATRFEEERVKKTARAREVRAMTNLRLCHLHDGYDDHPAREITDPKAALCGVYLGERGSAARDSHRLTEDKKMFEVTCLECLERADALKLPGAFRRLQRIHRREEAPAKDQ